MMIKQTSTAHSMSGRRSVKWRVCKCLVLFALAIGFAPEFAGEALAQRGSTSSTSSKRGFILYGDVKIVGQEPDPTQQSNMLDVILYTKGNQVYDRQRINPNGRYRFNDVFDGDYYLVLELEGNEVARISVLITPTSTQDFRQDVELEWRGVSPRTSTGVVAANDLYNRSATNKSLYQKSIKAIESKNYPEAIATLRQIVASDPNDFPAFCDLGMLYFIQKDYEAAENSYVSAGAANSSYAPAFLNLGRVRVAKKDYEHAIESLDVALKLNPKSAMANYLLGESYLQIKKGSKAVGYLNQALTLDPVGMAEAHLRLAALYNGAGMKDKAVSEYEQFLKAKPDYADRAKLEKYITDNKKP